MARVRRTPLAWRNVMHDKVRLLVSAGAVAFAVLIMFTEMGFLNGLGDSQSGVLRAFDGDLVMVSRGLHLFTTHDTFPRARLEQAANVQGVKAVAPVYVEDRAAILRNPQTGSGNIIRVIGFDPADVVFKPRIQAQAALLRTPLTILFDKASRPLLGDIQPGMTVQLGTRQVAVAGLFSLGPDYYYDGNILTSAETFLTLFPNQHRDDVFVGLIQLQPGASADDVLARLRDMAGDDIEIFKQADIVAREKATWNTASPTGYIFTLGLVVGFVIGVFICYQILFTDIADHLAQYATLKALGYPNRAIVKLVLTQAMMLGIAGFLPALLVTFGLYGVLTAITGIVTQLTVGRVLLVFGLTLGMCLVAGQFALRKALSVDPAELF